MNIFIAYFTLYKSYCYNKVHLYYSSVVLKQYIIVSEVDDPINDDNEAAAVVEDRPDPPGGGEAEAIVEGRPKRCRKRQRKEWKREERKRKRNSGKSYVSRKGKIVAEKQFSNLDCRCKKHCFNEITEQARRKEFESFWKIGTRSAENALICGLVKQVVPLRRRPTTSTKNQRSSKNKFYFNVAGESKQVCNKYFSETLKISDGRMTRAL